MVTDTAKRKAQDFVPDSQKMNRVRPATNALFVAMFVVLAAMAIIPVIFVFIVSISSETSIREVGYSFFPIELSNTAYMFLWNERGTIFQALFISVSVTVLGTLIGGILAIPFSFLASDKIVPGWVAFLFRAFILMIRTIPSLVWALVWIRVTGPNAFCGVVTQSICSIGMISKMYITAIADVDTRILESLDAAGCTAFQKIRYGLLPQIIPNFISTVIYRFDINVKDATTLGIVGAGGIGASLVQCISSRRWSMVGAFLCGMIVLMLVIEFASTRIRRRLAHG